MDKITVKDLDLYYGDFKALKTVNMNIAPNEVTAFIGPSGCGKSTLLKSLNRMNDLVEGCKITGEILLDGEDIYGNIDVNQLRKRVGMVFQKPNPFPMSVYDNIAYRGHLGRAEGPAEEKRPGPFRRPAAAPVHCPGPGGGAGGAADGRAHLCPGPHLHL